MTLHQAARAALLAAAASAALLTTACATTPAAAQEAGPTMADYEAIHATLYRYTRGLDRHDVEMYASAFAEDGVFDLGATSYTGRDEMRGIIEGLITSHAEAAERGDPPRQLFHTDTNQRIEFLAPDHAVHHAYYVTYVRVGEGQGSTTSVVAAGSSTDELRKIDGEWLIVKRTVTPEP